ncbi:MFS transporter [Metarhizium brunneum]
MGLNKEAGATANDVPANNDEQASVPRKDDTIPWRLKAVAVVLVSLIGFGSHWSSDEYAERNRRQSMTCFGAVILMILGAQAAYFWGVATGNNK